MIFTTDDITNKIKNNKIIIVIDNHVFDVTNYIHKHPGGFKIISKYNGKDCTKYFNNVRGHFDSYVDGMLEDMCIGKFQDKTA